MLAIRMQRTGRKGRASFRVVVQDSHQAPASGRVIAQLGSYNPHDKTLVIDKDKASLYLKNGARPSDKVARLLKKEGVKLPDWVSLNADVKREIKNPEKLRKNRPAGAEEPKEASASPDEAAGQSEEKPAETEEPKEEEPTTEDETAVEKPAEEKTPEEAKEQA